MNGTAFAITLLVFHRILDLNGAGCLSWPFFYYAHPYTLIDLGQDLGYNCSPIGRNATIFIHDYYI